MLGILGNLGTSMPWAPSAWKIWVDHILKQKERFAFQSAALIYHNGATASASRGFIIKPQEIVQIKKLFDMHPDNRPDGIVVQGKTYILKYVNDTQIVAFNGTKYFIITRAKTLFVCAICTSRDKVGDAAYWLSRINNRLIEKDFWLKANQVAPVNCDVIRWRQLYSGACDVRRWYQMTS